MAASDRDRLAAILGVELDDTFREAGLTGSERAELAEATADAVIAAGWPRHDTLTDPETGAVADLGGEG